LILDGSRYPTRNRPVNASHSLCVQILHHRHHDDDEGDGEDLAAGADERGEDQRVAGRPEHVSVDLLPAVLVSQVSVLMSTSNRRS